MRSKVLRLGANRQEIPLTLSGFGLCCEISEFSPTGYDYIEWHWHTDLQLCCMISGQAEWDVGGRRCVLSAGKGIFINTQQAHMASLVGSGAVFVCLNIAPSFLCPDTTSSTWKESVAPVLQDQSLAFFLLSPAQDSHRAVLEELQALYKGVAAGEAAADSRGLWETVAAVYRLWGRLRPLLPVRPGSGGSTDNHRLRAVLSCVHERYAEALTLQDIACCAGLSRSECCRFFREQTGQTLFAYLIQYRINRSLALLQDTALPIAQVAQACGFSGQSYYGKCFRTLMGCTPLEYRRQSR